MYSLSSDKINRVPAQGRHGDHSEGCTSTFTVMLISEARSGGVEGWRGGGGPVDGTGLYYPVAVHGCEGPA